MISIFAALVSFNLASPAILLLTTFLLSAAWALNSPAWLSILPSLVPKQDLAGAVAAHGVGYNLSRTVGARARRIRHRAFRDGDAVMGVRRGQFRRDRSIELVEGGVPGDRSCCRAERLSRAVKTGVRHAANNRPLRTTLVRALAFYPFAAAYWGLLPLIARRTGEGAEHYGLVLSMISAGADCGFDRPAVPPRPHQC